MSLYSDIFIESALVASIIPFNSDPTYFAMRSFGGHDMLIPSIIAVLGSSAGIIFNYLIGRLGLELYRSKSGKKVMPLATYNKFLGVFSRYFIVLLPFSWLPMLDFLIFLAGIFGISARLAVSLAVAGQIARYTWYLFS